MTHMKNNISKQNVIEQLMIAERALRYASASADFDSPVQREINDIRFRVEQTLKNFKAGVEPRGCQARRVTLKQQL